MKGVNSRLFILFFFFIDFLVEYQRFEKFSYKIRLKHVIIQYFKFYKK